jgi:hypothetical protein
MAGYKKKPTTKKRPTTKRGGKKTGMKKPTSSKLLNKAETCFLSRYFNGDLKTAINPADYTADASKSVCYEVVPIQITTDFADNWNHNVLNKFEEYRISSVSVQVLFKNVNNMVHFIMDRDARHIIKSTDITNDKNGRSKMVLENNNRLTLTWKPESGSSDYDYRKVKDLANMNTVGHADYQPPLAYVKIFQDCNDVAFQAGLGGCTTLVNVNVAVRNPVTLSESTYDSLTPAQILSINNARGGALN